MWDSSPPAVKTSSSKWDFFLPFFFFKHLCSTDHHELHFNSVVHIKRNLFSCFTWFCMIHCMTHPALRFNMQSWHSFSEELGGRAMSTFTEALPALSSQCQQERPPAELPETYRKLHLLKLPHTPSNVVQKAEFCSIFICTPIYGHIYPFSQLIIPLHAGTTQELLQDSFTDAGCSDVNARI